MRFKQRTLGRGLAFCWVGTFVILIALFQYGKRVLEFEDSCYCHRSFGDVQVEGRGEDPESDARGMVVVEALERFREDHQAYPRSLTELVPTYLACIPRPRGKLGVSRYAPARRAATFQLIYGLDPQYEDGGDLPLPRRTWDSASRSWGVNY
jgi:hypothetical protein